MLVTGYKELKNEGTRKGSLILYSMLFLKGIINGILVFSFWPGLALLLLIMQYIVNPFFKYVINPINSIISGTEINNDVDAGVLEQDISTPSESNT